MFIGKIAFELLNIKQIVFDSDNRTEMNEQLILTLFFLRTFELGVDIRSSYRT